MKVLNVVANSAAIASLISIGIEACERGVRKGSKCAKSALAVKDIHDYTGDSMLNKSSEKHNSMKEIARNLDITPVYKKAGGAVTGFTKGAFESLKENLPGAGFSVLTLCAKSNTIKMASTAGIGVSMAWDFLKNGTNLFKKKDLIE